MQKAPFRERLRYGFDNTMSRGPIALIGWLFLISFALIFVVSLITVIAGLGSDENGGSRNLFEQMWISTMRTLDAGNLAGDNQTGFRIAMFTMTIGGIFIVSTLIGVLTSGLESQLDTLRKGRSKVLESDHTLILGWSSQVFGIISELALAGSNQKRPVIVVMADEDKVEMEDEIKAKVSKLGRTRIVCRTGSTTSITDLALVNPAGARSIIVLSPQSDNPDSQVIKTLLALTNNPQRGNKPYHIVTEIHDQRNLEVARMVGGKEVEAVLIGDLIARITVQTCRQSSLSIVYTELLDFGGDEMYFTTEPSLVGRTFHEALLAYEDSTVMGLRFANGRVQLNPPMTMVITSEDALVVLSQDDDTIKLSGRADVGIAEAALVNAVPSQPQPEHTLLLGWNARARIIIRELNNYVAPGSMLTVVASEIPDLAALQDEVQALANQRVQLIEGDTTDRGLLNELDVPSYDHVIVLSYSEMLDAQEEDARTLMTLLHLRDMAQKVGRDFSIVSEMLDVRNRELAQVTQADDFIVSDKLVGLMLSQVAENKALAGVFADLFDADGAEAYLKPVTQYVQPGQPVNFYTLVEAAARRGETVIGYRVASEGRDASKSYGVHLNPPKSRAVSFRETDRLIVLAES